MIKSIGFTEKKARKPKKKIFTSHSLIQRSEETEMNSDSWSQIQDFFM